MKPARRAWMRGLGQRSRRIGVGALLLLLAGSAAVASGGDPGGAVAATTGTNPAAQGGNCGSVVIRHCEPRPHSSSMVIDTERAGLSMAPEQWEAIRAAGPDLDSDEIVVVGEREREPTPSEEFDRYLGSPSGPPSLISRDAGGGARCTTISRSGARLCSNSGGVLPGMGTPVTTWSFSF